MLEVKVRQPKCIFCPHHHRHTEACGKKLKGVYLRPTSRYCTGGKRPKVFKTRDPKERIPAWCPRRLSPCIVRVYHYKNPETVFLQNLLHPSGSVPVISATNYAVCYETRVDITAAEFQKEISILNLSERLGFSLHHDEVLELDKRNREIKQEVEALRADKNKISKQIGACMAQGKKEEAEELKKQVEANAGRTAELSAEEKEVEEKIKNKPDS